MHTPTTAAAAAAANIRAALERSGLSEAEAAKRSGIPQSTLNRKLKGLPPGFTLTELSSLATLLGTEASALLRQDEARPGSAA